MENKKNKSEIEPYQSRMMKICNKCMDYKCVSEFHKRGFDKNGNQIYRKNCKSCYNSNWKYRLMSTLTSRESKRTRPDGRKRNSILRDKRINGEFLQQLKEKQKGRCYWLNIPIDFTMKSKLRKPSLDRLDNSKGYTVENVVLTTVFANTGRRDASVLEMKNFISDFL